MTMMKTTRAALAAVTAAALLAVGAAPARAATVDVTNGGPIASVGNSIGSVRAVLGGVNRSCGDIPFNSPAGFPITWTQGPVIRGSIPNVTAAPWGTAIGSVSVNLFCSDLAGTAVFTCATSPNLTITGPTVPVGTRVETPGTVSLQCEIVYYPSGPSCSTTITGPQPVVYSAPAPGQPGARVLRLKVSGQNLVVTGPSCWMTPNGSAVQIGEPVGSGVADKSFQLSNVAPNALPDLASS